MDKVKKAAARVSTRSAEVAAKAGTRGARAIVETTVAAVKTVDSIQQKLGRKPSKAAAPKQAAAPKPPAAPKAPTAPKPPTQRVISTETASAEPAIPKQPRRAATASPIEVPPVAGRDAGRKTMPAASAKRTKAPKPGKAPKPVFKAKRGQKHIHTGR
ncbi:hypothetical protein STIAU_2680 [Stigmatella aurantiaca DW4/3-1]|uniref:Uncharacterized protein n=1 Tax=Stigmatella aurantiaca (strain DW4/3-1) TaxID=378806 RepID=Q098K4_STIAD|nr:hypothetical protein STIAU_2680 [Stigmatella aurantiaca DW4/3-1]